MTARWTSLLLIAVAYPAVAQPTLTLAPGGALYAAAGTTVGWGFTISNPGGQWIEITSANLCEGTSGVTTACQGPTVGAFTDFISAFNDIVAGRSPDSPTVTQAFNAGSHTGVGSFQVTGSAGAGTGTAQIVLTYNVFSRSPHDPAFDPGTDTVSTDSFLTAPASVTIASSVPALGTAALIALALLLAAWAMLFGGIGRALPRS